MKQLVCTETGTVSIIDRAPPIMADGDLMIRLRLCGICGTDLMKVFDPQTPKPVQLGHEVVGAVMAMGSDVPGFEIGQRVAVAHHAPDYSSHYSRRGSATMDAVFKSSNIDPGGFAQIIRVPAALVPHTVFKLPDEMPDARAVFMEPLACCLRALDRAPVFAGDTVAVIGVGAIGLLFVPLLVDRAATVIAVDQRAARLDIAEKFGAHFRVEVGSDNLTSIARAASDGRGADLIILTVVSPATIVQAFEALRDGGSILLFGVKPGMLAELDLWQAYRREINLITSYSTTPENLSQAMAILTTRKYPLENTITHTLPMENAPQGFQLLNQGEGGKIVVTG